TAAGFATQYLTVEWNARGVPKFGAHRRKSAICRTLILAPHSPVRPARERPRRFDVPSELLGLSPKPVPKIRGPRQRGRADLLFQRLFMLEAMAMTQSPSLARRCSAQTAKSLICRESPATSQTRPASPSLIERDAVVDKKGRFAAI